MSFELSEYLWAICALMAAICRAGMLLVNQYFKLPGHYLVIWSRVFILIAMAPFLFQIDWPQETVFYIAVAFTSIVATPADMRAWSAAARFGGGVVSRILPLTVIGTYLLWLVITPSLFFEYLETPLRSGAILLCIITCVYFVSNLRHCDISKDALIVLLPVLAGYATNNVLNKFAMDHSSEHGGVFAYIYFQCVLAVIIGCVFHLFWRRRPENRSPPVLITSKMALVAGLGLFITWFLHMVGKNYGMTYGENPAYIEAIILTAPAWIAIVYALTGHKEKADVKSGMGVVLAAIILVLLASK